MDWIRKNRTFARGRIDGFTNSLSSAKSMKVHRSDSRPTFMIEVLENINKRDSGNVTVVLD